MPITVKIESETFDAEIKKFRIESTEKAQFEQKCKDAGTTTAQALRSLIKAVNDGIVELKK